MTYLVYPHNLCRALSWEHSYQASSSLRHHGAVDFDMPFPELGLDSMMAMNLLRDAKQLVRIELSATMLWNHPSISQMSEFVAELLAPQQQNADELEEPEGGDADSFSVLDELFDSIESSSAESANAGSEGTI